MSDDSLSLTELQGARIEAKRLSQFQYGAGRRIDDFPAFDPADYGLGDARGLFKLLLRQAFVCARVLQSDLLHETGIYVIQSIPSSVFQQVRTRFYMSRGIKHLRRW